jgi:hypothetical protein
MVSESEGYGVLPLFHFVLVFLGKMYFNDVKMVSQWCHDGATIESQWGHNGVTITLPWCCAGCTIV